MDSAILAKASAVTMLHALTRPTAKPNLLLQQIVLADAANAGNENALLL